VALGQAIRNGVDAVAVRLADADRESAAPDANGRGRAGGEGEIDTRLRERLRLVACCLALTVLATSTRPGRILADTKIDMAVNPLGFLGRALHLWDPEQFGQLQNQAIGYLFPMGPFYALGDLLAVPAWITQRLWLALLMCLAFLGTERLARKLGIGGPLTRLVGGLVYALAPGGLAVLGQISSEYLPYAMLPWIVLPLVTAAAGGSLIGGAARSGLAVACCGGINAAATVAVLTVPALYLLTRPRGTPRLRLAAWWSAAVAAATAWWLVPLLLTGTYGFSWLTYTEKAETTTGPTGLINVLRGAERWVNYLVVDGRIWSPVGNALSLETLPVLCTGAVAALGLAGLLRSRLPERTFLLLSLLAGIVIITAGHVSALEGPLGGPLRELLDGPLAPLRNLHKFDGVVRLPLALGVAHLLSAIPRARHRLHTLAATYAALAGIAATALSNGLSGAGDFPQVPAYWRQAAAWLNGRAGEQAVLALPGAPFGEYLWGRPMDDIMQPLLTARWGVRQLVPAGSPGYTRALDAIDQRVTTGRPSPGLAEFLGRMGIRFLLVRNDLQREVLRGGWPARLHQVLDGSPGLRKVAEFGERVGQENPDAIGSLDQRYPALEIYEVDNADDVVSLTDTADAMRLYGAPEGMLTLADNYVLHGRPVLLNDDGAELGGTPVVTDSLRLVRRNFGELHHTSQTLSAAERHRAGDILDEGWSRYATTAVHRGIASVTASTSASDTEGIPQQHDLGRHPYAALDGDPSTYWSTGGWDGPIDQWIKVDFGRAITPGRVTAMFVQNPDLLGPPPVRIAVETETGSLAQQVRMVSEAQDLQVPPGQTRWLRIRILELAARPAIPAFARVGLAELTVQGVRAERILRLPATGAKEASYAFARGPGRAAECMKGSANWVCTPSLERQDEEGNGFVRAFGAQTAAKGRLTGTATLIDNDAVNRFTSLGARAQVSASSSRPHPAAQPRSAFDGDERTVWIAAAGDTEPVYKVRWKRPVTFDRITVARPAGARGPLRVTLRADGGQTREGLVDERGRLSFAPLRTSSLTLTFSASVQPVLQIADITVPGVAPLPDVTWTQLNLRCGLGPRLRVNGTLIDTRVIATMGDLLEGRPVRFEACRRAPIVAGGNRLESVPLSPYRIETVVIDTGSLDRRGGTSAVTVRQWNSETRVVEVDAAEESFLTVNENFNPGWRAEIGGTRLQPVRLDGWKQGWIVPAGTTGTITLTYQPDRAHKLAVLIGVVLLAVLALAAVLPVSRQGAASSGAASGGRRRRFGLRKGAQPEEPARANGRPETAGRGTAVVRRGAAVAAGLCAAAAGFWVAGIVGVALCAAMAAAFAWAAPGRTRAAQILASPWTAAALMVAGAASWALGDWLRTTGNPAAPTDPLGDAVPQLLGLIIVTRLVVGLWLPPAGPAAERSDPPRRDDLRWRPPAA